MFARALPVPCRTADESSFSAQRVAGRDVVARGGHAPSRLDARLVPGAAGRGDPGGPAGDVDLRERVEGRPERADPARLVRTQLRLVGRERRDGDVVLRARRRRRRQLRRQAQPVRRRVEDGAERPAVRGSRVRERAAVGRARSRGAASPRASAIEPAAATTQPPDRRSPSTATTTGAQHEQSPHHANPLQAREQRAE